MEYLSKNERGNNTFYRIRKNYDGIQYQIFQSPSKEITLKVYNECQQKQWKKEEVLKIMKYYKEHRPITHEDQYITRDDKGGYRIQRWTQGRVKYYGKSHNITEARKIRDYLIRNNWKKPVLHKRKVSPNKHLQRLDNGTYQIKRKREYYGTYNTYKEAITARNTFMDNDWNKEGIEFDRVSKRPDRYIKQNTHGKYVLLKVIKGEPVHFGTYHTLEDASEDRDFWESINWDFDLLDLH